MLTEELTKRLKELIIKDPKQAIEEIGKNPQILKALLDSQENVETERREKLKYVNMNQQMQSQLEEKSKELNTTQGVLIGAGIFLLLALLSKSK
jgi:hypothetical protein